MNAELLIMVMWNFYIAIPARVLKNKFDEFENQKKLKNKIRIKY